MAEQINNSKNSVPNFEWNTLEHHLERFGTLWNAFGTDTS